jgi:hypothetical protein
VGSEARIRLADAYRNLGRLDEAEAILRRQIEADARRLGRNHPRVAWGLSELLYVLEDRICGRRSRRPRGAGDS